MKKLKYISLFASALALSACGGGEEAQDTYTEAQTEEPTEQAETPEVSVGVVGEVSTEVWKDVASRLEDDGINLEVVTFSDYVQPNRALTEGDLDLNAYQHVKFLSEHVKDTGEPLVPIGYTIVSPMYIFSVDEIPDVESIPDGVTVAVSNSATSAERDFLGLEDIGLIELDESAGYAPTVNDITKINKDIEIIELDPSQLARALGDAQLITMGGDMIADAGMDADDAIYADTDGSLDNIDPLKKNVIAVHEDNADSEVLKRIVQEYQSPKTAQVIEEISQGSSIAAWEQDGEDTSYEDFQKALKE